MRGSLRDGAFRLNPHRAAEQRPIPRARLARAAGTVAALASLLAGCCAAESQFLRPLRITEGPPARAQDVWIDAPNSGRLNAWLFRPEHAPDQSPLPAVLFLHGRSDSITTYRDLAPWFADRVGAAILLVDYRGWGFSSDIECPTRGSMIADARAAYAWLAAREDVDPARLAVWGASLGGYPATTVYAEHPAAVALALWASPADVHWLIDDFRPRLGTRRWLAARLAIGRHKEPRDQVRRIGPRPVLLVHAEHDEIIPVRHAREIARRAQAAAVPLDLFVDPEGSHMVVSEAAILRIADFLAARLGATPPFQPDPQAPAITPPAPRFPPTTDQPVLTPDTPAPHAGHTSPSTSSTEFPAGSRT